MNPFQLVVFFALLDPKVALTVEKMGDDKLCVREAAHRNLVKMDERAVPFLMMAASGHKDAEVRVRSRRILSVYCITAKTKKLDGLYPWIDCLPKDFPDREKVIQQLFDEFGHPEMSPEPGPDPVHIRLATYEFARRLMAKGWSRKVVGQILDDMADNELQWTSEGGGRYSYPPDFKK
jgi:hypothetical protein